MRSTPPPAPTEASALLALRGVGKRYGAVQALRDASITIRPGEMLALCGENGAGKSTLVKLLTGVEQPDEGEIVCDGEPVRIDSPRRAQALGIALVAQELAVCPELSVLDNLWLGNARVPFWHRRARFRERGAECLARLGCGFGLDVPAGSLRVGERQLVEIDAMFAALDALRREGRAIVLVTHRLGEVFRWCDRIAVLRNGALVAEHATAEIDRDALIRLMLGRELEAAQAAAPVASAGEARLDARHLQLPGVFGPIDLKLTGGRTVALVGQLGSSAEEIVRSLVGLEPEARGEVRLGDRPLVLGSAKRAQSRGVLFVSGDRAHEGVFLHQSAHHNLTATRLRRDSRFGLLRQRALRQAGERLARAVGFDARRIKAPAAELSGGNQQKLAFGRCLERPVPGVLAMIEPTRGVDVGARAEIHRLMRAFCDEGHALLVASTDLEEVMAIADSMITLYRGRIVAVHERGTVAMHQLVAEITHPA